MRFTLALWFCFWTFAVASQHIDTQTLTANDGLISNDIKTMLVDQNGQLWIGSRAGLSYMNGTDFVPSGVANQYKFNNIYDMIEDPQHGKWVAGYGQGILYFNEKNARLINQEAGLAHDIVRTVFYHQGKIYVGTLNGVSIISVDDFSLKNPKFTQHPDYFFTVTDFFTINQKVYATTINDGIYEVTEKALVKVSEIQKTYAAEVWENQLYVSTAQNLLRLDPKTFKIIETYAVSNVWNFLPQDDRLLMVSSGIYDTNGGLYQLKNNQLSNQNKTYQLPFLDLNDLVLDVKNQWLYIGAKNNGLIKINLDAPVYHQSDLGLVYAIQVQENQQFVFHDKGFSVFRNHQLISSLSLDEFKKYQQKNPSSYRQQAIIQNHFYPLDDDTPADKIVFYTAKLHQNHLWVSSNIGLFEIDLNGKILHYSPVHLYHFTFFQDDLIAAVPYAGVRIFHDIHQFDYTYFHDWDNPDIPAEIVSIAQTDDAVYFASAHSGLYEYKDQKFRSLLHRDVFFEAKIKRICMTKNGYLAVVTDFNEVYLLDVSTDKTNIVKHISHTQIKGSSTGFVEAIDDVLYVGTNLGINVFCENKYFFVNDAQGFSDYTNRSSTTANQQLYVGGGNGYFVIENSHFTKNVAQDYSLAIDQIFVNNKLFTEKNTSSNKLSLAYNQNNIKLIFTVDNAKYLDKLSFKYRLKASEPWQDLTDNDRLNLNYLNDGTYNVELQITDENSGTISVQPLILLDIRPPFYYSVWFVLGCVLLILVIAWTIYKSRINYLKKNQAREQAIVALQNEQEKKELLFDKKIADIRLQALKSQMNSHFLFNVLGSIQYFMLDNDIDEALDYLERFSLFIRKTLEFSDEKFISLAQEIDYLKRYVEIENLRAKHPITFVENVTEEVAVEKIQIAPLLLQPFVENAIVHAFPDSIKSPQISLKVEKKEQTIWVTITDNGVGFAVQSSTHQSKGVSISQNRLELTQKNLADAIQITSTSSGTTVVIELGEI